MTDDLEISIDSGAAKPAKAKKAQNPISSETVTEQTAGPKKVRIRKGNSGAGPLHVPQDIVDQLWKDGISLQWVVDSVRGQPEIQGRQEFTINAWEPVTSQMFGKVFDGMWYPAGYTGELNVGGQVLMWRPRELTEEALAENRLEAQRPIEATRRKMKEGIIDGAVAAPINTPAARAWRKMETTIERPTIPVPD